MRKQTKTIKYIELLTALNSGNGFTFTEAQLAIWKENHSGENFWDYTSKSRTGNVINRNRGYMCLTLCGSENSPAGGQHGILKYFFEKGADGKYRRNSVDHKGRPLDVMKRIASDRMWAKVHQRRAQAAAKPAVEFASGVQCAGERSTSMKVEPAISYGEQYWYEVAEIRRNEIISLHREISIGNAAMKKCCDENHVLMTQIGNNTLTVEKAVDFLMKHRDEAAHAILNQLLKGNISF